MNKQFLVFPLLLLALASCGKTYTLNDPIMGTKNSTSNSSSSSKDAISEAINEQNCIDRKLAKFLSNGETVKEIIANTDITFCNGVILRLKIYKFTSKKYKTFGFVRSNSGRESCLTESETFKNNKILGAQGVLIGDDIKILLGGHRFNSEQQMEPSDHFSARYVKFDWGNYNGELAIFEKEKIRCWAIN